MNPASPFPPSFGGNPVLYAMSLASLMSIGIFGLVIMWWMVRDLWADRHRHHPTCLTFGFRVMMLMCGTAAFIRCMPEVIYMTCYGDPLVPVEVVRTSMTVKRIADVLSLPVVVSWMAMLVMLYPDLVLALRTGASGQVRLDPASSWPRLVRPLVVLSVVILISVLMAISKGAWMR